MIQIHAIVEGRVQGVFFRATTQQKAQQLGVRGWVKNLEDGTVETLLEGSERQLAPLLVFLHQGPEQARVHRVCSSITANHELPSGFEIIR